MGSNRSPTAARLWNDICNEDTEAIGIYNTVHDHERWIKWADSIIVMEPHHRKWIADEYPEEYLKHKIICLDIPDIYFYMQPELVKILRTKFKKIKNG